MTIDIKTTTTPTGSQGIPHQTDTPCSIPSPRALLPVRVFWRLRQFVRGVTAHVSADEMLVVAQLLPKAALCRFCAMPLDGQRHSLNVLYSLRAAGWHEPDLEVAALLHDVGKIAGDSAGISLSPWLRGPLVLLNRLASAWMAAQAASDPKDGWRYLLHVHREHPAIGAAWAVEDGCSQLSCWLIAHHQDKRPPAPPTTRQERLLALLQWADIRN